MFVAVAAAVGLTVLFWWPIWAGGGFVGGDLYTYYLPQKVFYADRLHAGEFPLWNNRTGHGYPLVGESQTGAFYPFHLLLYSTFSVTTAYGVNHLLHYVLAFVFTWLYARRLGLSITGGLFAGLVYTYGWFPPRSCLEWAIIGGAYLPLAVWCAESFLQSRCWRYLIGLSITLAFQMLAGHYNLAFITQLVLAAYVPLRLWFADQDRPGETTRLRSRLLAALATALVLGFAVAAVQLVPTWELKGRSQRAAAGTAFDPAYGHIPPLYWTQVVAPWLWYGSDIDIDRALNNMRFLTVSAGTNKVEAHLYFGLIPIGLLLAGLLSGRVRFQRRHWLLFLLGSTALVYTSGWLVPITRHLPGFGYFMGPGRFGIVTTLAVALLSAHVLDEWAVKRLSRSRTALLLISLAFVLTAGDLWWVSRRVTYAEMLHRPPLDFREESEVRRIVQRQSSSVRLFAPGPNLATLTGAASTPPYLGIGPREYYDPASTMPTTDDSTTGHLPINDSQITAKQLAWLQRAGVTHILSFEPLNKSTWPVTLIWQGFDPMLNRAWARYQEPIYLYRLHGSRGRVSFADPRPGDVATVTEYAANRVVIDANSSSGGRLVLTDLMYPGWQVSVDGHPAQAIKLEGLYRAVDLTPGRHTVVWSYRPQSVYWGAVVSVAALLLLAAVAHVRFWQR